MRAADLLDAGECHPACLLGAEDSDECICRCGGQYHGVLASAEVSDRPRWWEACNLAGRTPDTLAEAFPILKTVKQESAAYRHAKKLNKPYVAVTTAGKRSYMVKMDLWPLQQTTAQDDRDWETCGELIKQFALALAVRRRCIHLPTPQTWQSTGPFVAEAEAQVVAAILQDAHAGDPTAIASAITALAN